MTEQCIGWQFNCTCAACQAVDRTVGRQTATEAGHKRSRCYLESCAKHQRRHVWQCAACRKAAGLPPLERPRRPGQYWDD